MTIETLILLLLGVYFFTLVSVYRYKPTLYKVYCKGNVIYCHTTNMYGFKFHLSNYTYKYAPDIRSVYKFSTYLYNRSITTRFGYIPMESTLIIL